MVTAGAEPIDVYLCNCTHCQRGTGSAFSYAAIVPESAVSIAGESRQYRQRGDSERSVDSSFCPTCGTAVLFRPEGLPGTLGVPSAALLIRASLDPQSCSGPRDGITGLSFQQASPYRDSTG